MIVRKAIIVFFLLQYQVLHLAGQSTVNIGEVVVEDKAMAEGREIRKNSVTGKIVVTRRHLIDFGYSTAGDVIKNLPLVYIDSVPGVNRNVSIAGLDREYQAVLINGKKPAGGEDARDLKLDRIPVSMIDRIEINYNSPVSETADGSAGTVNIILKETVKREGFSIHAASDLHTSTTSPGVKLEAGMEKKLRTGDMVASLSWSDYTRDLTTTLSDRSSGINGGSADETKTSVLAANLAYNLPVTSFSTLNMHGFFSWFDEDDTEQADVKRRKDGTLNIRDSYTFNDKLRYLFTWNTDYKYKKDNNEFAIGAGYSTNFEQRHKDQTSEKSTYTEEAMEYEDQDNYSVTGEAGYTRRNIFAGQLTGDLKISSGISYNHRTTGRQNADRPEGYLLWDVIDESYTLDETIAFMVAEMRMDAGSNFQFVPALRYEYSFGGFETDSEKGNIGYSHLSPSFHVRWSAGEMNVVTAGIARHISRPAFMSMVPIAKIKINKDVIETGNPDLVPSRTISVNIGDTWYYSERSHISVNAYFKYVRDMITLSYTGIDNDTGYNVYMFNNIDTARLYGFYIDARTDMSKLLAEGLSLYTSYSYLGSSVRSAVTGGMVRIDDQPAHLLSVKIDYLNTSGKFSISLGGNYNSHRLTNPAISDDGTVLAAADEKGYLELAGRVKFYIGRSASVYISGDNLLAKPVTVVQGAITEKFYPGATFRTGLNIFF